MLGSANHFFAGGTVVEQLEHPVWVPVQYVVERNLKPDSCHHWPLEPTFPLDLRFLCLNRDRDVPLHRPDHLEIVYLEEGEVGYQVGSHTCTLRQGDIIVVGDNISHRCLRTNNVHSEVHSTVLYFRPELVAPGSPFGDDLRYLLPFSKQDGSFRNVISAESGIASDVSAFLHRIRHELPATSDRAQFTIRTYLKLMLALIGNHFASQQDSRDVIMHSHDGLARLRPVFDHLSYHYADSIHVEDAARLAAMSPAYFMHFFRKVTGNSFVSYLNQVRVARAKQLLSKTDKSIAEISHETGFCSQSYFGVIFRRISGITAFTYRAQARHSEECNAPSS